MSALRPFAAQVEAETYMTLRRGETLLLTVGIPLAFLVFFSTVHVVPTEGAAVSFFVPGILALAVMSTAMVSLGIATGFERGYGVLKRLGATPLGRPRLLGAKITTILLVEVVQAAVLVPVGYGLGWRLPGTSAAASAGEALAAALLATLAFGGIGLLLAGVLRAEVNLAAANGLYLVLLLLGGMIVPLDKLPGGLASVARALPAAALSDALSAVLGTGASVPAESWVVLALWAVAAPVAAALTFRWE
jgi:ABC-2 type transport system permease protein